MFPEDAIHGFNYSRVSIAAYLETVPDPGAVTWSPCADPDRFYNTEALRLNLLNISTILLFWQKSIPYSDVLGQFVLDSILF